MDFNGNGKLDAFDFMVMEELLKEEETSNEMFEEQEDTDENKVK